MDKLTSKSIQIKILTLEKFLGKGQTNSKLHFNIKGPAINYVLVNTLRRIILSHIPVFSWTNIQIDANSSVYNSDYMRLRVKNLVCPVPNPSSTLEYEPKLMKRQMIEEDEEALNVVTMYVDVKNESDNLMSVTTDMCSFYTQDGEKVPSLYQIPHLLTKIKNGEEFKMTAMTELGIGLYDSCYSATSICCYEEVNDNEFIFKLESDGQLDEQDILMRAIQVLKSKLIYYQAKLVPFKFDDPFEGSIIMDSENHTLGNLLSYYLQSSDDIVYAGYKLPHLLVEQAEIGYITKKGTPINKVLDEVFTYLDQVLSLLEKTIA